MIPTDLIINNDIVDTIYGNEIKESDITVHEKVILAPRNVDVLELNNKILDKLNGPTYHSYGIDYIKNDEDEAINDYFPTEFMNSMTPNGLPPYDLKLKRGAILILIRNINITEGLCNGTRLKLINIKPFVLTAKIISGISKGKIFMLPRIELQPSSQEIAFTFIRRQFPVRLGYAITINRAQGQSFEEVGVLLTDPVFSHGQLYVAASGCKYRSKLHVALSTHATFEQQFSTKMANNKNERPKGKWTKNIVYPEVLV